MADGKGCICLAYGPSECACDADWTPQEIYDLKNKIFELKDLLNLACPYVPRSLITNDSELTVYKRIRATLSKAESTED